VPRARPEVETGEEPPAARIVPRNAAPARAIRAADQDRALPASQVLYKPLGLAVSVLCRQIPTDLKIVVSGTARPLRSRSDVFAASRQIRDGSSIVPIEAQRPVGFDSLWELLCQVAAGEFRCLVPALPGMRARWYGPSAGSR
jgi:hypothetical protein